MSVLIDYNRKTDEVTGLDLGTRSGTVNLRQSINLDQNKKKAFRVSRVIMSPEIPNVYTYNGFTNDKLRCSNDGGATWITIGLKTGIYTVTQIEESIIAVLNTLNWFTKPTDAGITLSYNPATRYIYTKLDSSKLLVVGQLAIDYSTLGNMYQTLGYELATSIFLVDGLYTATLPPALDSQSTYVELKMSCIQGVRWINGQLSNSICRIPIQSGGQTEIVWPASATGFISPLIPASIPSTIDSFTINVITGNGRECVFMYGNLIIEIEIVDI